MMATGRLNANRSPASLLGPLLSHVRHSLALRAGRFAQKHGKRLEWAEGDELEFHHASHTERKLFQKLMRFGNSGAVHDEDDAVRLVLEEPLVDFAGQMETDRRAYFERQHGGDRVGRSLGRHVTNRQDFGCWNGDGSERREYSHVGTSFYLLVPCIFYFARFRGICG